MKIIQTVLLILLLCASTVESAQAGIHISAGRSSTSSAFRSGFSSQKSNLISRETPKINTKSTAFGSFGAANGASSSAGPTSTQVSGSALSRDLSTNAANANALKTLDARNQPATAATPATTTGSAYPPGNMAQGGYAPGPTYAQAPIPQTVIIQRGGGFSASPFLWFMLGHSMANHDSDRVVYQPAAYPPGSDAGSTGRPVPVATVAPQKESFGASLLRVVLWLIILTCVGAAIIYALARRAARIAKNGAQSGAHYTLGKV